MDGLSHAQDLFSARLVVVGFVCVLFEVGDKFVVGVGPYSERADATGYFFRHVSSKSI